MLKSKRSINFKILFDAEQDAVRFKSKFVKSKHFFVAH